MTALLDRRSLLVAGHQPFRAEDRRRQAAPRQRKRNAGNHLDRALVVARDRSVRQVVPDATFLEASPMSTVPGLALPPPAVASSSPSAASIRRHVLWSAAITALGGLLFGYDTGVTFGALLFIGTDFHGLSSTNNELLTSILLIGAVVGALCAGRTADVIGRRRTVPGTAAVFVFRRAAVADRTGVCDPPGPGFGRLRGAAGTGVGPGQGKGADRPDVHARQLAAPRRTRHRRRPDRATRGAARGPARPPGTRAGPQRRRTEEAVGHRAGSQLHTGDIHELGVTPDLVIECTRHGPPLFELGDIVAPNAVSCLTSITSDTRTVTVGLDEMNKKMVLGNAVRFRSVNVGRRHYQHAAHAMAQAGLDWLKLMITRHGRWAASPPRCTRTRTTSKSSST